MSALVPLDECNIVLGNVPATDAFGLSLSLEGSDFLETVPATGPGVFRTRRRRFDGSIAELGQFASKGTIVGFLQRGPLLLPVLMPRDGWLLAAAPEGGRVEYGSPVFRILCSTEAILP